MRMTEVERNHSRWAAECSQGSHHEECCACLGQRQCCDMRLMYSEGEQFAHNAQCSHSRSLSSRVSLGFREESGPPSGGGRVPAPQLPPPREGEPPGEALTYSRRAQALLSHYPSSLTHFTHRVPPAAGSSGIGFRATRFSTQLRSRIPAHSLQASVSATGP